MRSLEPGDTIGIIGGGQLARMMASAAARLGFHTIILEPTPDCPAAQTANRQIVANYDDEKALDELANLSDVITYEFENVPAHAVDRLAKKATVLPKPAALEVSQDRFTEVEFFVLKDGSVLANELAPRVHNSGHWTEAACLISQFEQHIRAVAGLPLGKTTRHSNCVMENLIGEDVKRLPELLAEPQTFIDLYGKAELRAGRKMGHIVRLTGRAE